MLRISHLLIAAIGITVAHGLQAECFYPEDIDIPDGTVATYEEMRDSQIFIREYMAEMETYLRCLEREDPPLASGDPTSGDPTSGNPATEASPAVEYSAGEYPADSEELFRQQRRHTAIDRMEAVAAKFDEQVLAFKKINP